MVCSLSPIVIFVSSVCCLFAGRAVMCHRRQRSEAEPPLRRWPASSRLLSRSHMPSGEANPFAATVWRETSLLRTLLATHKLSLCIPITFFLTIAPHPSVSMSISIPFSVRIASVPLCYDSSIVLFTHLSADPPHHPPLQIALSHLPEHTFLSHTLSTTLSHLLHFAPSL